MQSANKFFPVLITGMLTVIAYCLWQLALPQDVTVSNLLADPLRYNGKKVHLKAYVVASTGVSTIALISDQNTGVTDNIAIVPTLPGFDWIKRPYVDLTGTFNAESKILHLTDGRVLQPQTVPDPPAPTVRAPFGSGTFDDLPKHHLDQTLPIYTTIPHR